MAAIGEQRYDCRRRPPLCRQLQSPTIRPGARTPRHGKLNSTFTKRFADGVIIFAIVDIVYTPILIVLGTIGHLISISVLCASKLRVQSSSQYLSALAVSDTIFLFLLLRPWLNALGITEWFNSQGFCQIFMYMLYVTCCLSAWLVVAFTVERFVVVLWPLRRVDFTPKRARYVVFGLAITTLLLNTPLLWLVVSTDEDCYIDLEYLEFAEKFNLIDTLLAFVVPFFVNLVLNTSIVVMVYRRAKERKTMTRSQMGMRACGEAGADNSASSQQQITRMLLIVSSVFVVLNLPAYTMRIVVYAYDGSYETTLCWMVMQKIARMLFNTNFGINFVLYCLSGQNFRRALRETLPWLSCQERAAVVQLPGTDEQRVK